MKTNEPRSVVKHTRTITTFYFSDELNEEQLKSKIELFLEELELPDSCEEGDVQPVTNECPSEEIDEVKTFSEISKRVFVIQKVGDKNSSTQKDYVYELESELNKHNIPYDLAMYCWQLAKRNWKQAMQWLPK
jgi:hypothetical protein